MAHLMQGHRHHVVHAVWHLPVQAEVPFRVFRQFDHHVRRCGIQILPRQLVGQGDGVLPVGFWSALKVMQHFVGGCLRQNVGRQRIPIRLNVDRDHRLDRLAPNVNRTLHGGLGFLWKQRPKLQIDDGTAGSRRRRVPMGRAHRSVAVDARSLQSRAAHVGAGGTVLVGRMKGRMKGLQSRRAADILAITHGREQQAKGEEIPAHHGGYSLLSNINIRYKYYIIRRRGGFFRGNDTLLNIRAMLISWAPCKANWRKTSKR